MKFIKKVEKTIEKYGLLEKKDRILLGVSGGPDSLALLYSLLDLREKYSLELFLVSINHMFRGRKADEEAEYVKKLADSLGLECFLFKENVPQMIEEKSLSPEEAGHLVRHRIYGELKEELKIDKIALGHHADDRAETILMHLIKGAGLKGLAGMPPKNGSIIRPLAELSKEEILDFCQKRGISYYLDPSNEEKIYLRNKIRLDLLPYIKKNLNPNIIDTLLRLEDIVFVDNLYLEKLTRKSLENIRLKEDEVTLELSLEGLLDLDLALQRRVIREAYLSLRKDSQGLSYTHVENILQILPEKSYKSLDLAGNVFLEKNYSSLIFSKKELLEKKTPAREYSWDLEEDFYLEEGKLVFKAFLVDELPKVYEKGFFTVFLDREKLKMPLSIRFRKDGDRIQPLGMKGSKKLKDLFIDKKIDREKRDQIALVCSGDEIIWIPGISMSDKVKVKKESKNYIRLECRQEDEV